MSSSEIRKDLLSQLLYEASAYKKFDDIEKLVDQGFDLSQLPVQPLYVSLQNAQAEQLALVLPKLSTEQRQALRDIDLWQKDTLDPEAAIHWIEIYAKCPDDEVTMEFLQSEDFLLSLKNQFTIQTFDAEDPEYPDNDNYFLTDDTLLLVEYKEDFPFVQELKDLIRKLYSHLGVENAYSFLFKMVVDSYSIMEEQNYQDKVERLRDFGFVDYYQALEYDASFRDVLSLDSFIKSKKGVTSRLDNLSANQALHASSLVSYQIGLDSIHDALLKVNDPFREKHLQFSFVRLVNAKITLADALKSGSMALNQVGTKTKAAIELGYSYLEGQAENIFDRFDFVDLYRIGHSLIELNRKKLIKPISKTYFEHNDCEYFIGQYWGQVLAASEETVAKYKVDGSTPAIEINSYEVLRRWEQQIDTFTTLVPFMLTFFKGILKLKEDNLIQDNFYLNYEVDSIDFEALMISSFINFSLSPDHESAKMGVKVSELKEFYHKFFFKRGEEYLLKSFEDKELNETITRFSSQYGLSTVPRFENYFYQILVEQLNGYEFDNLTEEDFKHIGGPILLNSSLN